MTQRKSRLACLVGIALALLFTLMTLSPPSYVTSLELFLYDLAMNLRAPAGEIPNSVVLLEIDEKSIARLGPWPWPRRLLAEMVGILDDQKAKVIGLHVPLTEKDPYSGLNELRAFKEKFNAYTFSKKDDGLRSWVLESVRGMEESLDSDRALVERTIQAGNVILAAFIKPGTPEDDSGEQRDDPLLKSTIANGGLALTVDPVGRVSAPFVELAQAGLGVGHAGLSLERGMEGRSHPLFIPYKGRLLPSFPLQAAMALVDQGVSRLSVEESGARIQDSYIPLCGGEMLVDFRRSANPLPRYSFGEVLKDGRVPGEVDGKIAVIGFNLNETPKIATPSRSSAMPLIEFQAHVIQAVLAGEFIHRPSHMIAAEVGAGWVVALVAVFLFLRTGRWSRLMGMCGMLALLLGIGFLLLSHGTWMKTGLTAVLIVAIYPALGLSFLIPGDRTADRAIEVSRLVGITLQEQGLLDQALEHFRKLPLDRNAKDLLYRLGMDYESRSMIDKALSAYEIVRRDGEFRDLDDRIKKLRNTISSPAADHGTGAGEGPQEEDGEPAGEGILKIARYEIIHELGKGSMGLVYKARDPKINRLLAVKTIRFSDEFDPEIVQEVKARFFREAEIAGRLSHPSIVTIYDVGEDQDLTYMAMEYLEGDDLEKFIKKGNLLPLRRVLEVVANVAEALDYAHKAGVIHRDIKPANIMLLKRGGVKVTDFGIAKAVSSSRTRTGVILGTPNYMSPEQIMGQRIDYRTDIFSLGVLFYQSVTGELPFHGENLSKLLYQITQVKHTPAKELAPRLPKACEQIIDKALAKNPGNRFSSAGELGRLARLIISKMDQIGNPSAVQGLQSR